MTDEKPKRFRGFCFTLIEYTDNDIAYLMDYYKTETTVRYLIMGFEIASRTHIRHIQGYVYYPHPRLWKQVVEDFHWMNKAFHVEPQGAKSNVNAYEYCMKEGDYIEFGERPRQGHRTDLEVIKHDLLSGRPISEISKAYFAQWCQYRRAFNEFIDMHQPKEMALIGTYDDSETKRSMAYIVENYPNSYIVTKGDMKFWEEVCKLAATGHYKHIFIPNNEHLYYEHQDDVDFSICEKI